MKYSLLAIFLSAVLCSCTKHVTDVPACGGRLYGYRTLNGTSSVDSNAVLGEISLKTNTNNSIAIFSGSPMTSQGAYCNDLSYYSFDPNPVLGIFVLQRAHLDGTIKRFRYDGYMQMLDGLLYSSNNNKLYCFEHYYGSGGIGISEIKLGDSTFTVRKLNSISGQINANATISSTIDDKNGIIYFSLNVDSICRVIQYEIKDSSIHTLYTGKNASVAGMQFNKNNNTLYALKLTDNNKPHLISITDQGTISTIDSLSFDVNPSSYSTCYDACSNNYIISSMLNMSSSTLSVLDLTGRILKHDTIQGMYQGLYIR